MTPLSGRAAVVLVARREIAAKLRDKGFLLSTAFIAVAILASVLLPAALGGDDGRYAVGTTGNPGELPERIEAQARAQGLDVEVTVFPDREEAADALADDTVDAVVVSGADSVQIEVEQSLDAELRRVIDGAYAEQTAQASLESQGIDAVAVAEAFAVPPLPVVTLDADAERDSQRQVLAIVGVTVLYSLLILIGQYVAMGVVEEKSSRVVELLLSTIRPWQLLAGKVIGLGLIGLAQLVIIGVVGVAAAIGLDVLAVPSDAIGTLAQVVGWFILGYTFYAAMFAAGAALVSRQEDLQTVLLPMIVILVAALLVAIQAVQNPDGPLAVVTSLLPGLSPLVMPVRMAAGGVAWWELVLSVALMLAAIAGMVRLGGRIYAGALLRSGGRVSIKDAMAESAR